MNLIIIIVNDSKRERTKSLGLSDHESKGNTVLRNVENHSHNFISSNPMRLESSASPLSELQISQKRSHSCALHEGMWENVGIAPPILILGTRWG